MSKYHLAPVQTMKVAVLWSGGKESCLAYYKATMQGYDVACTVTFVGKTPFLCHPLPLISLQSKALGIQNFMVKIKESYKKEYVKAISHLMETNRIEGILTGDISFVNSFHGNWIEEICKESGVHLVRPLWGLDPYKILSEVVSKRFKAIFTCVRGTWFDEEWLGCELDQNRLERLKALNDEYGIDLCGEKGEYHTMVVDAPIFREAIHISKFGKERKNSLLFIKINELYLKPKTAK